jgi:hypothetical protein
VSVTALSYPRIGLSCGSGGAGATFGSMKKPTQPKKPVLTLKPLTPEQLKKTSGGIGWPSHAARH